MQNTLCHYLVRRKMHVRSLGSGSPGKDEDPVQLRAKWMVSVAYVLLFHRNEILEWCFCLCTRSFIRPAEKADGMIPCKSLERLT
jgi:hypothetical protein